MKCSDCGHSVGKKANFCSKCGKRLSVATKHTQDETSEPKSLVAEDTREKSEINPALDNNKSVSPKRPNDFDVSMQKKKKKRKKGKNKKDDSSMMDPKSQSNPSQKESVRKRRESSSSEDSKDAMDEGPDSVQDEASHTESLDSSMASTPGAEPSEHTTGAVRDQTTDREEASDRPGESGKDKPNSPGDQIVKTAPSDTPTERPIEESKSVMSPTDEGKKSKSANKNMVNTRESVLDHNANMESNGKQQGKTNQTGKNKSKQKTTEQKMVFGPQPPIQAQNIGSSVDPEGPGECAEVQDSGDKQESDVAQIPADIPAAPPPKRSRSSRTIDAANRFTVCFHAVLSKDFKIDLDQDQIFVRAGPPLGTWEEDIAELSVTRDLGEHGFLVEGSLPACKKQATMISIPYKYIVYKAKKNKYEYEFIYKQDSTDVTNRCLFVKETLLDSNGDWHQYDDIICVQPTKVQQFTKSVKTTFFGSEQREGLIKGRQIAGNVMLETIFELLKSWTDVNLKNFWLQLKQFFEVYSKPFVYEEKQKRWLSLDYGEDNVKNMLKEFMVHRLLPQQEHGGLVYGLDPLRAAVVMWSVCQGYSIGLKDTECFRLCAALCLPQMTKEDFTNYWADFSREVPFLRGLSEKLASLINAVKKTGNPNWILVLPLRHILNGTIKPFEEPDPVKIKYGPNWAGLEGLEVGTSRNMNSQQKQAMVNALKSRSYLIKMDPILVRSCLHLISLDELVECAGQVNVELLDMLVVVFNNTPTEISSHSVTTVSAVLEHIHGRLVEDKYSCFTGAYRQSCLTMIVKLLDKLCKGVKPESYTQNYPDVPLICMNILALVTDFVHRNAPKSPEGKAEQQNVNDCVSQAKSIIRNWMARSFKQNLLSKGFFSSASADVEIQLWNNIISICFAHEEYTKSWRETFSKEFKGIYQRESARKQIEYYCSGIESLENSAPCVAAIIEMCALEAVPSLCQNKNEGQILERIKVNWKFVGLISAIIEKSWPSETPHHDDGMVLQHLLSWTAAKHIFQLYGAEKNVLAKLSEEAKKKMDAAISALVAISDDVADGNIKIALLNVILEKKEAYLDLLKIAADCFPGIERYQNKDKMKRLMECRQTEVKAVYHEKELFNILLTMTVKLEDYMTVSVDEMVERQQVVIESKCLRDFMEVHQVDHLPTDNTGVVTYFQLDRKIRDMAKDLYTLQDSHLFNVCWEKVAKQVAAEEMKANNSEDEELATGNRTATSKKIRKRIFQPAYSMYQSIYELLKGGQIKLKDINQLFGTFKGNYEGLTRELLIMNRIEEKSDEQWIHSRVQQIEQYHELHLAVASAEMIMMVKETLCLQGDFRVLETLREVNHVDFQNEQLNRIDNNLMKAKKILVDINEPRRLCLEELGLRRHFVKWVKDALEDINELKVFVDLASISAGENDMDVDRVACFHDAVLGYSSMLYELKPDSDFHVFQEVVKKLWRALENDPNLPKKLRDTARHLEWLKTVKDSHGSVELSSLSLASAINNKGIYLISAPREKRVSLDTVLKLQILEENDEGQQMRCYSLEDLRELQNKLMLMSGKGDQGQNEVDHFAEVFDGVQRLCETFITLYTAGNPLVQHWEARIRCCLNSQEPSIVMDFHLDNVDSVVLEGSIDTQLTELCRKMEKGLKDWAGFVREQRLQYYYLNCYTAEQIVYLCSKLSQQNVSDVEDQVLMMLSLVKPDCTASDLRQVKHTLQYELLTKPEEENDVVEPENDLDPCVDSAVQKFDQIWDAYMADMKNFLPHILDIKSLGRLLQLLADKASESDVTVGLVNRQLPKGLVPGNPNLIVCPHSDILTACLSIYMSSEDQPLPTYDEVLLCTPSTPYEQVEIFLRRCLSTGYKGQKIYSLLFGDLLTYDVSSKVEKFFQQMKMQSRKDYRLVIICSTEREHSYIPSAFSQNRVHVIPQESVERLRQYLHRHFVVPQNRSSAAAAFKDRLCVGVVSSQRAGVGKSLYIKRLYERLKHSAKSSVLKCIRLINPVIDEDDVLRSLLTTPTWTEPVLFHFDVTSSVRKGLHEFLFKLLILRYLMDSEGKMWKCRDNQLYLIEVLQPTVKAERNPSSQAQTGKIFFNMFPFIFCRPPNEVVNHEMGKRDDLTDGNGDDPLMDDQIFRSEAFQRPYQYLQRFHNHCDLDSFRFKGVEGSHVECLQIFLLYCGVSDPSWAELRNFVWFLNHQLRDCETSVFCNPAVTGDLLTGFKTFVVDFMILMAKDFATPSLSISDQSPGRLSLNLTGMRDEDLAPFQIRKRWETELHPYIFFNDDHESMTFIGFHLQPNGQNYVDAIDPSSQRVIKKNIMTIQLYENLKLQGVPFNIDFDGLQRGEKIERLCRVLGIQWPTDPDETYELTTDNILKMLAIHMRFRCGIPVIIMGETGCGKTRLIKFLCELQRSGVATDNMKLVKVHGGTTSEMIYSKVREAECMAIINNQDYNFDSVLFFDEANTTEAISSIKEVLCDKTIRGESFTQDNRLQIIAACNPYRKHKDEMIQRLESAGLGYRVRADKTDEKLGSIPLRQLVYRVQALPPSMIPLVWDFGQLNDQTEKIYIQQIVQRVAQSNAIDRVHIKMITKVLSASQKYMRQRCDECSFVSLRDVERCMQCFVWFIEHHVKLFAELEEYDRRQNAENNDRCQRQPSVRDPVVWSLVMSIGVCYHACLEYKEKYRQIVSKSLPQGYNEAKVMQEISLMQDLLLSGVPMGNTIARNSALKENVFMMVLCIELRIPLFLVGKPGSSKSLSKTLVADAMQGQAAHSDLYKMLKQVDLVSFQCSPHSTPEGIINIFKQCGRFQKGKNLAEYTRVVVLDEIGLAEDSPKMPLKTLHPLLEEGCIDDDPLPHKKVGFIGISNWALDPAKMNRGIFVSRGDPDEKELIETAKGICRSDGMILEKIRDFFQPLARAYLKICRGEGKGFFGLRDYYSLIKMIFAVAKSSQRKPTSEETVKAVLRNFSGKQSVDTVAVFTTWLPVAPSLENINAIEFVRENIQGAGHDEECRYLLVLTRNCAALKILQQTVFSENCLPEIIFGSSFPKDQEYTQICRNINRVKICMETGQTVVLLNLQNLYESLYDALNQYYVCLGDQKYVDLGLGSHRVKCRVHRNFRLIVIEERDVVYKQFPIPLINRLEKHYLDIHTVLKTEQKRMVEELEKWVALFVSVNGQNTTVTYRYQQADVFIGYHSDMCASVVLQVIEKHKDIGDEADHDRRVLDEAKLLMLKCATPDSVVRLDCTDLPRVESEHLATVYFQEQSSSCLADFIVSQMRQDNMCSSTFTEVTTFSRLLTVSELEPLKEMAKGVELLSLQQFETEHSFLKKIRTFLTSGKAGDTNRPCNKILIIQCDFDEASDSTKLIISAKHSSFNEINKLTQQNTGSRVFVYFITRLPRMEGGTSYNGFHGGVWRAAHIDDLRRSKDMVSDIKALQNMTISQMFESMMSSAEAMEIESMYTEEQEEVDPEEIAVDTTALVRSCVQSAAGMLRDQGDSGLRSAQRVEILLTLLCDHDEIKAEFLQTVKAHLHSMLRTLESNTMERNWVIKEASNFDALQEGGTFRHTLWKRVQTVVVPLLAQLVSVVDRDQNLDILFDEDSNEPVKRLWLDIFSNDKLLEIPHLTPDHSDRKTLLVQNSILQNKMSCSLPFSWRIRNYLEELWVLALQQEGRTQQDFEELFWKTPLGRYVRKANLEMQVEFYQRYLQDFVCMTMNVTCPEHHELFYNALCCCVDELRLQLHVTSPVISFTWVHAAYHHYKNRMQNLSRMICIEPQVLPHLLRNQNVTTGSELVLDVYAALACVECLEPRQLDTDEQRQAWLQMVKKLQVPIELVCSEESLRNYGEKSQTIVRNVQAGWSRIFSLSLFVENVLLGIDNVEKKLTPVVLEHTRQLGQILEKNSDLKTHQAFQQVIALLKICKEKAVDCLFRLGSALCAICIGDPQDPLCLPCDHIYCQACLKQWLCPGQMFCPLCTQPVNDDFQIVPSEDVRVLVNQHARFRKQCNAFFIDLVTSVCFKDNSPPCSDVIRHLLSFLIVEAKSVPLLQGKCKTLTKMLSPFDDSVDKNPVVRSVVLKLLLKYSFDEVQEYLQQHLSHIEQSNILEKTDKTELYLLYINCLEDSMYERFQFRSAEMRQVCLQDESFFLMNYLETQSAETATVAYLQQVARVRMDLDMAARLIVENVKPSAQNTSPNGIKAFLDSVEALCRRSGNEWYRVYLIQKVGSQCGVDFVSKLLKVDAVQWLFPQEVLQKSNNPTRIDHYLVCGEQYQTIRNAVAEAVMKGIMEGLDQTCKSCACLPQQTTVYLLLALHREVTALFRDANDSFSLKQELLEALLAFIQTSTFLTNPAVKAFAEALVRNQIGPLRARPGASTSHYVLVDLTIHLAAVLLCGHQWVLAPLQQLAHTPANMQKAFLPSMPDDMQAAAREALGHLQWYYCPNGHPIAIGECGQPTETSRCLDCGAAIGGTHHQPLEGFHVVNLEGDRTQTGHVLGDPSRRNNADMLDTKSLSPVPFTVIRMLTHMALLLGARSHHQSVSAIIKPVVPDPGAFLHAHLKKDLQHLIRCLGKGTDDTISTVHLLINSLLDTPTQQRLPVPFDNLLSTKVYRNGWETEINNSIIAPQLKHLDRQLKEVNALIRADSRVSASPVMMLLAGDPRLFLASVPKDSLIHCSTVWSCREKISLQSLTHIVELNGGKDSVPVLWTFLHKEAELRLVKHLPDILALQRNLVKRFQNVSVQTGTIREFLNTQNADGLKAWYKKHIGIFLTTWNQLRVSLATNGEIKIPAEYCQSDMDHSSDFSFLLPRRQGPGLCSTALISYLISLHNNMVYCMDKHMGEETSYRVSPVDLTDLHVIRYELERDLMPLILSNTQYSIERGQESLLEYDLAKIQQQLVSRFLLGKPLIILQGIPTLVNRYDRNYEVILRDLKAKVQQEPLQMRTMLAVAAELQSYSEVCEALSTLEVALGFLSMTSEEPHMQLSTYLEEVLQMGTQMPPHILKALSMCCLKHCAALWQLLSSLKSENMLQLKRDPFPGVSELYKQALGEEEHRLLTAFFSKNSAEGFLLEMHEFLVLVLKNHNAEDTFKPEWSLAVTLFSYMERKDLDVSPEMEEFPEELLLAHYVEAWKFIVAFKQERQRQ